jgi:hypothetical protein
LEGLERYKPPLGKEARESRGEAQGQGRAVGGKIKLKPRWIKQMKFLDERSKGINLDFPKV